MRTLVGIARGAFRPLAALFMTVVVISALSWAWNAVQDRRLEKVVSQTREWPEKTTRLMAAPVSLKLKTRCSQSRLYYLFTILPAEDKAPAVTKPQGEHSDLIDAVAGEIEDFGFTLSDRDGFQRVSVAIKWEEVWPTRDENDRITALLANGSTLCAREEYAQAAEWALYWRRRKR